MAAKIVELADADRAIRPDGGVLVFMDNDAEAEIMRASKLTDAVLAKDYTVGTRAGNELNAVVGIAITTRNDTAGYNFVRMGAIVTGCTHRARRRAISSADEFAASGKSAPRSNTGPCTRATRSFRCSSSGTTRSTPRMPR